MKPTTFNCFVQRKVNQLYREMLYKQLLDIIHECLFYGVYISERASSNLSTHQSSVGAYCDIHLTQVRFQLFRVVVNHGDRVIHFLYQATYALQCNPSCSSSDASPHPLCPVLASHSYCMFSCTFPT